MAEIDPREDRTGRAGGGHGGLRVLLAATSRAFLGLTRQEQNALIVLVAVVLLGLAAKVWHARYRARVASGPVAAAAVAGETTERRPAGE